MKNKLETLYLDWFNNFLTVERFAEYYKMPVAKAQRVIRIGRCLNHRRSQNEQAQDRLVSGCNLGMVHNNTCLYAKGESIMKYKQVAETLDGLTYEIRLNERNLKDAKHIDYTNDIQARIVLFKNAQAAIWIGLKEHEKDIVRQYLYVFTTED